MSKYNNYIFKKKSTLIITQKFNFFLKSKHLTLTTSSTILKLKYYSCYNLNLIFYTFFFRETLKLHQKSLFHNIES